MSPWPIIDKWGTPTFYLQSQVYEFAEILKAWGNRVPDLAMAGVLCWWRGAVKLFGQNHKIFILKGSVID